MDDLYTRITQHAVVNVTPSELNKKLDKTILKKIKSEIEGKCMKDGFIRPNSVLITSRSLGKAIQSQFNGALSFSVEYVADLCNPVEGDIFQCRVEVINKMGIILVSSEEDPSPVNVLLAKQHHMDNETFIQLKVGETVYIKVIGKRFDSGESQISIIGILSSKEEYKNMNSTTNVPENITSFEVDEPKEQEETSTKEDTLYDDMPPLEEAPVEVEEIQSEKDDEKDAENNIEKATKKVLNDKNITTKEELLKLTYKKLYSAIKELLSKEDITPSFEKIVKLYCQSNLKGYKRYQEKK